MMTKISTVLADDHALSSAGLQLALENHGGFEVLGRASAGPDAAQLILTHQPMLAVLDYSMPGANGLEVFHRIRTRAPGTKVAILTGNPAPAILQALKSAGIDGVFLKSGPVPDLIDGLLALVAGQSPPLPVPNANGPELSAREFEVLCKTAEGLSVRATAEALAISPKTVETHKTSLMRKMGVGTTAELIVAAIRAELVQLH